MMTSTPINHTRVLCFASRYSIGEIIFRYYLKAMCIPGPSHIGEKHPQNEGVSAPLTNDVFCYLL
jgi:hypothetical protein